MQFLVLQVPQTVFLKVADYAKTIEREPENVLGAKGKWNQNTNLKNAVSRMSEKVRIQLETGGRIEDIAL